MKLGVEVGESFSFAFLEKLSTAQIQKYLTWMLARSAKPHPNIFYPEDQEWSEPCLYFWFILQETFIEEESTLPQARVFLVPWYTALLRALIQQVEFPPPSVYKSWSAGTPCFIL